jgi:microcin C transport system substrate-binding protein
VNRRSLLKSALLALAARPLPLPDWISPALAQTPTPAPPAKNWQHGLSLFGDLKYQAGFKQFEYVNANAPKGGTARQTALGTFDNFNLVIAGVKGSLAAGVDLLYETLLMSSLDEVSSGYGLLAEGVSFPPDFSSASYRLRAEAKWQDGSPVTPDDVMFSFDAFKKYSPQQSAYYRHVTKVEKTGDREVTFTFDGPGNRELPQILGELTVLPKLWWEGTDQNGKKRDVGETTLEPPLGSGPYRIRDFSAGRNIVYERVKDHWSSGVNVNVGSYNFDELHYEYFRDTTVALEAFKADTIDWRTENSAKNWATAYDFPAVSDKRVVLEEFPIRNVGMMQGFAFNIRREKFQDPRVRLAFNYAFDFEEMNKQIFFGQYHRISSYRACGHRPAYRPRARTARGGARQGPDRGFQETLQQSGHR